MTYTNTLKQRLNNSQVCIGAWLTGNSPIMAEAMATVGFHFLVVDMEHGAADISQAEIIFAIIEKCGVAPLARIGSADGHLARRLLDLGAAGIIVSTVQSADDFEEFSRFCHYPPRGHRGVGVSRCNRFGDNFDEYLSGFDPVLVPMIETRAGVDAAEHIAALSDTDALFLGPYDLSTDLGQPGAFDTPGFEDAVSKVKAACDTHGKSLGIHEVDPDPDALRSRLDAGFELIAYGTDVVAMRSVLQGAKPFILDAK